MALFPKGIMDKIKYTPEVRCCASCGWYLRTKFGCGTCLNKETFAGNQKPTVDDTGLCILWEHWNLPKFQDEVV